LLDSMPSNEIHERQEKIDKLVRLISEQKKEEKATAPKRSPAKPTYSIPSQLNGADVTADLTPVTTDSEIKAILDKAMSAPNRDKFKRLWSGQIDEYDGDDSDADMALCGMLAYWSGANPNPKTIEAAFSLSELGKRSK